MCLCRAQKVKVTASEKESDKEGVLVKNLVIFILSFSFIMPTARVSALIFENGSKDAINGMLVSAEFDYRAAYGFYVKVPEKPFALGVDKDIDIWGPVLENVDAELWINSWIKATPGDKLNGSYLVKPVAARCACREGTDGDPCYLTVVLAKKDGTWKRRLGNDNARFEELKIRFFIDEITRQLEVEWVPIVTTSLQQNCSNAYVLYEETTEPSGES